MMLQTINQKLALVTTGVALFVLGILEAKPAQAFSFGSSFDGSYSLTNLGPAPGIPPLYGGLTFLADDPNTLLMGGNALRSNAGNYAIGVTRNSDNRITGFSGEATFVAESFGIGDRGQDAGLAYGPDNVLFYASSDNSIGQLLPGSTSPDKLIDLAPLGVLPGPGSANFVPEGFPGAGQLKITSFAEGGLIYDTRISPDGMGTFDLAPVTGSVAVGDPVLGLAYVDDSYPGFTSPSVLASKPFSNAIIAYDIDANGNPIVASSQDFLIDILKNKPGLFSAPLDMTIDPLTGDILLSTQGPDHVMLITAGPPDPETAPTPAPPPMPAPDDNPFEPTTLIDLSGGLGTGSGTVSTGNEVFAFMAESGDLLNFNVEATEIFSGNEFADDDSVLYLYNSLGEILAVNDDSDLGNQARIVNYLIEESGTYYAGVTSFGNDPIVELGRPFNTLLGFEGNGRSHFAFDLNIRNTPLPETARLFDIALAVAPDSPFGSTLIDGDQVLFVDLNGTRNTDASGPLQIFVNAEDNTLSFSNFEFVLQFAEPFPSTDINDILDLLTTADITGILPPDQIVEPIVFTEQEIPSQSSQTVPEPASVLGLLAVGALGASSKLKRKS